MKTQIHKTKQNKKKDVDHFLSYMDLRDVTAKSEIRRTQEESR